MRRILLATLAAIALAVGPSFAPAPVTQVRPAAEAHDTTTILAGCTGYVTTASYTTAGGNTYESRRNLCHGLASIGGGGVHNVEAVERAKCYRNGVLYGNGTGGCRWEGYTDSQFLDDGDWVGMTHDYWCDTCGGEYIADSGRHYGPHVGYFSGMQLRIIGNNRAVRFYLADGSTVLLGENTRTSGPVTCCNW
jgi:hypothetical protein